MDPFVSNHLQGVSRTYAIVVPMLPAPLDEAVGIAYLLMRIVDTLEDAQQLTPEARAVQFGRLEAALAGDVAAGQTLAEPIGDLTSEQDLMREAPEVFRRVLALEPAYRDAICTCARAMSRGVGELSRRSVARQAPYPAIHDESELREYCYYVAGTVGEMLCDMMAHFLPQPSLRERREVAVELGIGLQLVNILKDARKDSRQGRRYLPQAGDDQAAQDALYRSVVQTARQSLRRGIDFVLALPASARELRSFCGLPIAWGGLTLTRAEQDASHGKIDRAAIQASIDSFKQLAGDDQALRGWLTALLAPPVGAQQAASAGSA